MMTKSEIYFFKHAAENISENQLRELLNDSIDLTFTLEPPWSLLLKYNEGKSLKGIEFVDYDNVTDKSSMRLTKEGKHMLSALML